MLEGDTTKSKTKEEDRMTINKEIEALKAYTTTDRSVLSIYLNTNPADPEQLNGAWAIHLKSGLKRIGEY